MYTAFRVRPSGARRQSKRLERDVYRIRMHIFIIHTGFASIVTGNRM